MSFREKSAWIFLISILLVAGFFFLHLPWTLNPPSNPAMVHALFYCILVLVAVEAVAHVAVALQAPEEAKAPKDERERLIDYRAVRVAHYVYVIGSLGAVATIHLEANKVAIGFLVLLAFVVGEIVKNLLRIAGHRGWM
ncbi:MAG TPA: hypothetical protein VLV83_12615 [Acidobacteriota bacterium]|nr:hypothetical protein [Acidobacteriota bacterium]